MAAADVEKDYDQNKVKLYNRMKEDGKLVSPIDLMLEGTHRLLLESLKWVNIEDPPKKMKLTNTGETVILSAKWPTQRPYLSGGPLTGNYVFSQIHFHWGSDEHEGSEHTVKGISYPMEMHVVFYKTRYLTQEAALTHDDGILIVVYLVKLTNTATSGLQWIVSHLNKVFEPHTSTQMSLSPLSALIVPFSKDYLVYWGALQTTRCTHTMLWLVSRAALGITLESLNIFRSLLNERKEPMNKNFRGVTSGQNRYLFHVNPSSELQTVLLPSMVEPPGRVVTVNYSHLPPLSRAQARQIFNKGDGTDDDTDKSSKTIESEKKSMTPPTFCEGNVNAINAGKPLKYKAVPSVKSCTDDSSSVNTNDSSPKSKRGEMLSLPREIKRRQTSLRKELERKRKEELDKRDRKVSEHRKEIGYERKVKSDEESVEENICLHHTPSPTSSFVSKNKEESQSPRLTRKQSYKSRLPVPAKPLQSSIAQYFQRPESAPSNNTRRLPQPPPETKRQEGKRGGMTTTIPRPLGRNAGKLDTSFETGTSPLKRPTTSPVKP